MFTIKWSGMYADYSVKFDDGWNRLNSCNAATYKRSEWSIQNELNKEIKTETFYLVSYATPIIYIQRKYYMDSGKIISTDIYVNEISWNCSRTTIRHISRFCQNLNFFYGIDVAYQDIKRAMRSTNLHFGFTMAIKNLMSVTRVTPNEIKKIFETQCPKFW